MRAHAVALLLLAAGLAGCAAPGAQDAQATTLQSAPFVDRFNMTVRGAGTPDACFNVVPIDPAPMVAVNRPGATIRFEFEPAAVSGSLQGSLQIEIVDESGERLAVGVDPSYVVLDVARSDLAVDARMVTVRGRVCDSEAGILEVEAAVTFFEGAVPEDYSAL